MRWVLHVRTYELDEHGRPEPVLEHLFFGRTKQQAEHYAASHSQTDKFFSGCGAERVTTWRGINCYSEWWWERV